LAFTEHSILKHRARKLREVNEQPLLCHEGQPDRLYTTWNQKMFTMTSPPEHFEMREGYACFRPAGEATLQETIELVSIVIAYSRQNRVSRLLINILQLTGFPSPSVTERYYFVHDWASQAMGVVKVALVAREEMLHPEKFGATVAFNTGFNADAFASESEALAWLLGGSSN
jgi:hypothetical protein